MCVVWEVEGKGERKKENVFYEGFQQKQISWQSNSKNENWFPHVVGAGYFVGES